MRSTAFKFCFQIQLAPLQQGGPDHAGRHGGAAGRQGGTVQVDPIKPKVKAPGTKRLKPKCDEPLSSFAFKFNLRR
jgi:hypothetical protein